MSETGRFIGFSEILNLDPELKLLGAGHRRDPHHPRPKRCSQAAVGSCQVFHSFLKETRFIGFTDEMLYSSSRNLQG